MNKYKWSYIIDDYMEIIEIIYKQYYINKIEQGNITKE